MSVRLAAEGGDLLTTEGPLLASVYRCGMLDTAGECACHSVVACVKLFRGAEAAHC